MWQDTIDATNWLLGWFLIVTAIYFLLPNIFEKWPSLIYEGSKTKQILLISILAGIVRFVPIILLPVGAGYDIQSFRLVGEALLNGQDVYTSAAIGRHPYLPFQMYWIGLALKLHLKTSIPFVIYIKLLPAFFDILITILIYHVVRAWKNSVKESVLLALLFAFNPISILVTAYHGQFDAVSVFLILFAWYWAEIGQKTKFSALALGLAILNKTWPIVFLPITLIRNLNWRYWLVYVGIALSVPILVTVTYVAVLNTDPAPMLRRALTHTGPDGYWGWSAILTILKKQHTGFEVVYKLLIDARRWLILVAGLFTLWWTRKETVLAALVTIILAVFTVSAGMGMQWLLWVVPLAILDQDHRWLRLYSFTGMIYLLVHLYGLHMYPWLYEFFSPEVADIILRLGPVPAWLTVLGWTISRIRKSGLTKRTGSLNLQNGF